MRVETQKRLTNPFGKGFAIGPDGVLLANVRRYEVTVNFASVANGAVGGANATCSGVKIGDVVLAVGAKTLDIGDDVRLEGTVTAADTVRLTLVNDSGGAVDLAESDFRIVVAQFQDDE